MKKCLLVLFIALAVKASAQMQTPQMATYSDPAINDLAFETNHNVALNPEILTTGEVLKIKFKVSNLDAKNSIKPGTCQLKISLGTKFALATDFLKPDQLPLKDLFGWKVVRAESSKQYMIVGELLKDMPAGFTGLVSFELMPVKPGTSTLTAHMLISNLNNKEAVLSDVSPANNYVSKTYTSYMPLNLKFTQFSAKARGCLMDVSWSVNDENNAASNYVIETSADGVLFNPVQIIAGKGKNDYGTLLENLPNSNSSVRIKAEAVTGQHIYSSIASVPDVCKNKMEVAFYPNPLPTLVSEITLQAKQGIFNGKYAITIADVNGKEIRRTNATYNNKVQVTLNTGAIVSGSYFISIIGEDGQKAMLKFVKL